MAFAKRPMTSLVHRVLSLRPALQEGSGCRIHKGPHDLPTSGSPTGRAFRIAGMQDCVAGLSPDDGPWHASRNGFHRLRRLLVAASLFLTCASAEGRPSDEFVPIRFTVFSARPIAGLSFVPGTDADLEELEFFPTARSPRYEYRGPAPLVFLGSDGRVAAEARIPEGMNDVLLLFIPAGGPAGAQSLLYRIAVIDDTAVRHGAGGFVIIDLSELPLSGTVNRRPVTLRPGLNSVIPVGTDVRVVLRTEFRGRSYQAYAHAFELGPGERALLILFPPYYLGSLEVQSRLLRDEAAERGEAPTGPTFQPRDSPRGPETMDQGPRDIDTRNVRRKTAN